MHYCAYFSYVSHGYESLLSLSLSLSQNIIKYSAGILGPRTSCPTAVRWQPVKMHHAPAVFQRIVLVSQRAQRRWHWWQGSERGKLLSSRLQ